MRICLGVAVVCAMGMMGCNKEAAQSGPAQSPDEANGATVTGKVTLAGSKPVARPLDMSATPACSRAHPASPLSEEVEVGANGGLKNVFVQMDGDEIRSKRWKAPETAVVLDQVGCMYQPHMVGVMTTQNVVFKNSDATNHNIRVDATNNVGPNVSQPPGDAGRSTRFDKAESMMPVKCQIHPWMRAYINVVDHPFFAVTGEDGTYTIKGIPAGTYTVHFTQEKYGTREEKLTVALKDSKTLDFEFKAN